MNDILLVFGLLLAYLLGSIPSAVWIGKGFYDIDVRQEGSRNAGATNTIRVLGLKAGIPVLLRQYLKLGGKLLGFSADPEFSDVLDGLIVVDLTKTEPRLLERYLGRAEAASFAQHHRGVEHHNEPETR